MSTTATTTVTTVTRSEGVTVLDPSVEELIVAFNNAKAAIKELEAQQKKLDTELRSLLAGNLVGSINGVERVRIVTRNMSKIDREALKSAFPEAYEATHVESTYTVLSAK